MRVLWIVNMVPYAAAQQLHVKSEVLGGWIESMAVQLTKKEDMELGIACKSEIGTDFEASVDGISYFSVPYNGKTPLETLKKRCAEIIDSFRPDLIQIEGTEFLHARAMIEAGKEKKIPTVVSMQGILNGQYQYQCGQLQIDDMMFSRSLTNIFAAWILHLRKTRWYKPRMKTEREVIEQAGYILGRTTWDRAHAYSINPSAGYFSCSRNLREPFYRTSWDPETMERHSLYVGNGYFALKGVHYVIEALPQLIREYPDIRVYVAGTKPFSENDKRAFYKKGYGAYLEKRIKTLGVGDHIVFTGPLKAEEVAERLSKTHVYVLCSAIENSPNTLGEAMLVGTPCVAAYVGGVSDMAEDGKEALFYRNDDPSLLAWNVKRIFDDDTLARTLSENAKKKAAETHDTAKNAEKLYQVYREILNHAAE